LIEKNNDALHEIAEQAAKLAAEQSGEPTIEKAAEADLQKVGDFYASGMNEEAINQAKIQPLQDEMKRVDAITGLSSLTKEIGRLHSIGVGALFGFTSGQDDKNSTMVIAQAFQGGLALPDRDYYTKDDDASKKLHDQYVAHVTKMFTLLGDSAETAAAHAKTVLDIETSLAKPARTRVELRDPQKNYNKMSQAELQKLMPDFKWNDYFQLLELSAPGAINVGQPDFFKAANHVFKTVSLDDWKTYLRWHLVHAAAPTLSQDLVDENFAFYGKTLTGTEKLKPRWKRVVSTIDNEVGEALGKLYVADHFPPEAKQRALEMVSNLKEALADRIKTNDWMDEPTKKEALKKLAAFTVKIGYPDKWRDYSLLKIDRGPYALNVMRSDKFEVAREMKKIGKPVDRSEWGMSPPTVNAYYNPNGELTQGENIADIGGLKIAYAAFQKALAKHPEDANKKIDGFTPDQRFFLAWAQIWRANQRDEDTKLRLNTDPHSPGRFRSNGPVSNMPEFQKAFDLPDNSAMVRPAKERANIW